MDSAKLRDFVEVMRRGSFAAVARDRGIDPSSVSRAIAGLEAELGLRLFERSTRRLAPTEAGALFFQRIEPIVEQLEDAQTMAREVGSRVRGTLRITAPLTFAQLNLVPLLPELADRYPELSLELLLTEAIVDLVAERIDIAIRLGRLADSTLIANRLAPMVYVVSGTPEYLERHGRPQTPQELAGHNCLLFPIPGHGPRWRFRKPGEPETEVQVSGRLVISNGLALRECSLAGMGLTLLPRGNVWRELGDGTLVDLFPDYEVTPSDFDIAAWLLYPSRSYLPLKVRAFIDFLKEKFGDRPPWDIAA